MKCLIIKNDGIGDLICTSGIIQSIGHHFNGNVDLITCIENKEIAEGIEHLDKRLYVSRDGIHFNRIASLFGKYHPSISQSDKDIIQFLQNQHYDYIISLRRFIRQSTLILMNHVKGNHKHCAWQFPTNISHKQASKLSQSWSHYNGPAAILSEQMYHKQFISSIWDINSNSKPNLSFCTPVPSPETSVLGIGIGGNSTNWPDNYWMELTSELSKSGWSIKLFGGENMLHLSNRIKENSSHIQNFVGKLNWHETANELMSCRAYIGNDTGLSHFASIIVEKCLIILGGGTFRRFFPWPNSQNQHIIFHGMDCFDCDWKCKFSKRKCMHKVYPKDVIEFFHQIMLNNAPLERDINPDNCSYKIGWQRSSSTHQHHIR